MKMTNAVVFNPNTNEIGVLQYDVLTNKYNIIIHESQSWDVLWKIDLDKDFVFICEL